MRSFLIIVLLFFNQQVFASPGGNAGGNGGDFVAALKEAGLYDKVKPKNYYSEQEIKKLKNEFLREGLDALWALFILVENGYEFRDGQGAVIPISQKDIYEALVILKKVVTIPGKFKLINELELNGEAVTAKNYPSALEVELSPVRWRMIEGQFDAKFANRLKGVVVAHEMLSMIPARLETTGNYDVSLKALDYENAYRATNFQGTELTYQPYDQEDYRELIKIKINGSNQITPVYPQIMIWTMNESPKGGYPIISVPYDFGSGQSWHVMHEKSSEMSFAKFYDFLMVELFHVRQQLEGSIDRGLVPPEHSLQYSYCNYNFKETTDPIVKLRQYRFDMLLKQFPRSSVTERDFLAYHLVTGGDCVPNFRSILDVIGD